jgi:hypothetical protein
VEKDDFKTIDKALDEIGEFWKLDSVGTNSFRYCNTEKLLSKKIVDVYHLFQRIVYQCFSPKFTTLAAGSSRGNQITFFADSNTLQWIHPGAGFFSFN